MPTLPTMQLNSLLPRQRRTKQNKHELFVLKASCNREDIAPSRESSENNTMNQSDSLQKAGKTPEDLDSQQPGNINTPQLDANRKPGPLPEKLCLRKPRHFNRPRLNHLLEPQQIPQNLLLRKPVRFIEPRLNAIRQPGQVSQNLSSEEPGSFHRLRLSDIEEPEETPQVKETLTLKNISKQLKSLCFHIHLSEAEIKSWESLETVHKKCQKFNAQKCATRKECDTLQRKVRVLIDKAQNHSIVHDMYKKAKAEKEDLDRHRQSLLCIMEERKERLKSLEQLEAACAVATQENEEFQKEIKVLENKLQDVSSLEEACAALEEKTDALNLNNKAKRQELELLKQNRDQEVKVLQESFNRITAQKEAFSQESDALLQELLELKDTEQRVQALLESCKAVNADKEAISQESDALLHEIQELHEQVQFGKALLEENGAMRASTKDSRLQIELETNRTQQDVLREEITSSSL